MLLRAQPPGGCEPGGTTQGEVLEVHGSLSPGALTMRLGAGAAPSVWGALGPQGPSGWVAARGQAPPGFTWEEKATESGFLPCL